MWASTKSCRTRPHSVETEPVDEHGPREMAAEQLHVSRRRPIPLQADQPERGQLDAASRHGAEQGRHRVIDRDGVRPQPGRDPVDAIGRHVEGEGRGPVQERSEETGHGAAEARRLEQRHAVVGADAQRLGVAHDVVEHAAVSVQHALASAGGARRVVDIGAAVGREPEPGVLVRPGRIQRLDAQHLGGAESRQRFRAAPVGEDQTDARLGEEAAQVRGGPGRLQRHVHLAGLQRAEDGGHQRGSLAYRQRDGLLLGAAALEDGVRDPVGRAVQRLVAQRDRAERQRQPIGMAAHPALEPLRDRLLDRCSRERLEGGGRSTGCWVHG